MASKGEWGLYPRDEQDGLLSLLCAKPSHRVKAKVIEVTHWAPSTQSLHLSLLIPSWAPLPQPHWPPPCWGTWQLHPCLRPPAVPTACAPLPWMSAWLTLTFEVLPQFLLSQGVPFWPPYLKCPPHISCPPFRIFLHGTYPSYHIFSPFPPFLT